MSDWNEHGNDEFKYMIGNKVGVVQKCLFHTKLCMVWVACFLKQ